MEGFDNEYFGEVDNENTRWVIVTNLEQSIDDYDIRTRFEKFGHVPEIRVPFETEPKYGKCAKVKFALAPAARAACSKLGGKPWRDR
eukprot:UN05599